MALLYVQGKKKVIVKLHHTTNIRKENQDRWLARGLTVCMGGLLGGGGGEICVYKRSLLIQDQNYSKVEM